MISRATRKNLIRPSLSTKMHQRKVDTQHPLSIKKHLHHHKPTRYVNVTAEIQPGAHSTVNVFQKTLFVKQLCQQLLIHITAVVKIFKFHYNNHTKSFRHQHCRNDTELSKHIWDLKNGGIHCNITQSIAAYVSAYRCGTR